MNLEQFDNEYAQTEVEVKADVPEGDYNMRLIESAFIETKEGRPILKLHFQVTEGDHKGYTISKISQLDNPERFKWLKKDMVSMGIMVTKISQLPEALEKIKGNVYRVHAKQNGKYVNYYINGPAASEALDTPF